MTYLDASGHELFVGDFVTFIAGGPTMVVTEIVDDPELDAISCSWFNNHNDFRDCFFKPSLLEKLIDD